MARFFNRRMALVVPFLAVFFFPLGALIGTGVLNRHVDWNGDLLGLRGDASAPPLPLNPRSWWTGDFQKSFAAWWENNCPNRSFLIRLFNQVDYSCLRSTYMLESGIVIGPGGQLNLESYVLDACHQGTFPPDRTSRIMGRLEHLRTLLQKQGKSFLVLTTPSKPATDPETIPVRFRAYDAVQPRAYDELVQALGHSDIPLVDGAGIIHELEGKSPYPLFLQGGIHWDSYATAQVLPAFAREIGRLTGKPFLIPTIAGVRLVKAKLALNHADHDTASLLNLLSRPYSYLSPQLDLNYPPAPLASTANVVLAGGSFDWNLLTLLGGTAGESGMNVPFAYYGNTFYDVAWSCPISRTTYERALSASDLVVLEINEAVPETTLDALLPLVEEAAKTTVQPDREISFAQGGDSADFISSGFGPQEAALRRTVGDDAVLVVPLPSLSQLYTLTAQVSPFPGGTHREQRVEILVNDKKCGGVDLTTGGPGTLTATFPASAVVRIRFHFSDAISSDDKGRPGLAFYSLRISPAKK